MNATSPGHKNAFGLPFGPLPVRVEGLPRHDVELRFHAAPPPPESPELILRFVATAPPDPKTWLDRRYYSSGNRLVITGEDWQPQSAWIVLSRDSNTFLIEAFDDAPTGEVISNYAEPLAQCLLARKGATFMHASGVVDDEGAWLFPAWGQTGKTTLVLALLREGAAFLGDDLVIVDADGNAHPYARGINLFGYNVKEYPELPAGLFAERAPRVRKRERLLATLSRRFLPSRASAYFRVGELIPGARIGEPAPITRMHSLVRTDVDWETRAASNMERTPLRHQAVLAYEFRNKRGFLDTWRLLDPGVPELAIPADPIRRVLETARAETIFLPDDAGVVEKLAAVRGEVPEEIPPAPRTMELRTRGESGDTVAWHDLHGLFRFVIRGIAPAGDLARIFAPFKTDQPGADVQFAIRDSRIVSRRGATLLEGRYAILGNSVAFSECDDLAKWNPGLVRSIRMEAEQGTALIVCRPFVETHIRRRRGTMKILRRDLSADDLLYDIIEPTLQGELLKRGATFLHAAGAVVGGEGSGKAVLLCAPSGFGKTALLLSFLDAGAKVLGDDYVIATKDGSIRSWPVRMNLYERHLENRPDLRQLAESLGKDRDKEAACTIYRGSLADFFPERVVNAAPLAAVVCLTRGRELACRARDTDWAARFNGRLLDDEFAAARALSMAAAFARGTAWQPMHDPSWLQSLFGGVPVLQVSVPWGVDWSEARDSILQEVSGR